MITKQLSVGDYIFNANGELARITKVNKKTYSYAKITGYGSKDNINFNGKKNGCYYSEEWFECEDATAKALELAFNRYKKSEKIEKRLEETEELIGKAKFFLEQVKDIETLEVDDE